MRGLNQVPDWAQSNNNIMIVILVAVLAGAYLLIKKLPTNDDTTAQDILTPEDEKELTEATQPPKNTLTTPVKVTTIQTETHCANVAGAKGKKVKLLGSLWKKGTKTPITGKKLNFYISGKLVGSAVTAKNGTATLNYTLKESVGKHALVVKYPGLKATKGTAYTASASPKHTLTINKVVKKVVKKKVTKVKKKAKKVVKKAKK